MNCKLCENTINEKNTWKVKINTAHESWEIKVCEECSHLLNLINDKLEIYDEKSENYYEE